MFWSSIYLGSISSRSPKETAYDGGTPLGLKWLYNGPQLPKRL